jgi:hypothetical protein
MAEMPVRVTPMFEVTPVMDSLAPGITICNRGRAGNHPSVAVCC